MFKVKTALERFQSTLPARGATPSVAESRRKNLFQSTLPARGATGQVSPGDRPRRGFNPRSPRGERRAFKAVEVADKLVSIHAPRAGSDLAMVACSLGFVVSIHAPRAGSDTES